MPLAACHRPLSKSPSLTQAAADGTLTQEQADALAACIAQMHAGMGSRGGMTGNGTYGNCPFATTSP